MILEQYIPTQTSHNSERPPAASVVEMQRKKSFVYNRILISKNAQMTERERTKFIAGYAIFAILSATAMVVGVCAEWLEYPFLNGDLINIGISLTCICGTQMLSQLHALHESIARLKQRQKMIPLRTKKINESFTSSEEVSVLPPALTADDSSIRSSNISSSSFSDLGPKNGHSSSFIANPGRIFVKCPSDRRFAKTLSSSANNPKSSSSNNNNFVTDEFEVIVEEENSY